jgi:antitoxin component YwqK of YwqJK toxin-antitoxin module
MTRVLKEEKYSNGSLKFLETELHDQPGQRVIFKESWYPPQVDPLNPWQATDNAQQRSGQQEYKLNYVNGRYHGVQEGWYDNGRQKYKLNFVNGQQHGVQEYWYPSRVDPEDPAAQKRGGQQWYKDNYVNGERHGFQEDWYENGQQKYKKYYLDGTQVSQEAYQTYTQGLEPAVQAILDFGERGLSGIIARYLLP